MSRVCLVTDELYPFTRGGIGRILHNLIQDSLRRSLDVQFLLLLPSYVNLGREQIAAFFGDRVQVEFVQIRDVWQPTAEFGAEYPPAGAFTDSDWHSQSLDILLALKRLSGQRFDVIEFPDYRGWAYCALQEKLLGMDFEDSLITVRLHSTDGILQRFEAREPSLQQLARFELERKALHDSERVIAHLATVAEWNAQYYGFEDAWKKKVSVEFPPVLDGDTRRASSPEDPPADILFITKQQPFKRPDAFIRGSITFLRAHPEHRGRVVVACHAADEAYSKRLRAIVPQDLANRFLFLPSGPERDALIPGSVVVISSAYESLNLAAYEAAAAGASLVLNGSCIAFGEGTPWRDGVNCHKYDGTVDGLAAALSRAVRAVLPEAVVWESSPPYWLAAREPSVAPRRESKPLVSLVIPNFNLARWLPETLASIATSTYDELEVLVVDDASTGSFDAAILQRLESDRGAVRVIRNAVNRGLAASRNIGIAAAKGKYILPLDADDCIGPRFIEQAVRALEARPEYDVVVPTAGYFETDADLGERKFVDYACFLGDVPSHGLVENRMSCATSLMRRSLLDSIQYDETLDCYEDWSLYLRAVHAGRRFLVTNDVQFYYRRRPGSMISGMNPERHLRLLERMYMALPRPLPASVYLFGTLGPTLAALRENQRLAEENQRLAQRLSASPTAQRRPVRHDLADKFNATVKKVPLIHPVLKATVERLRALSGNEPDPSRPVRYDFVDALNGVLKKVPFIHPLLKATGAKLTKPDGKP